MSTLPSRMSAVLLTGHGDLDRLEYRCDVPVPHPQPDDVLVRVSAAGINNTDINLRIGWYSRRADTTDAPGATQPQLETLYLGSDCNGAFAEYVVVPAINAHPIQTSLSDVELACIPCSFSAAENMLERAVVRAGDTVLITGASGGVGSAAVQLARRRSAQVVALAGTAKAARVSELGAGSCAAAVGTRLPAPSAARGSPWICVRCILKISDYSVAHRRT